MVDGLRNLDDGYIPPIFTDLGGRRSARPQDGGRARRTRSIWTRRLADVGIFAGLSTGAAMAGAARCAAPDRDSGVIVIVSPDGGWKYLSTGAWTGDIDEVAERAAPGHLLLSARPSAAS